MKPKTVSLYCGAGIGECAAKMYFKTVLAVDYDLKALEAYRINNPRTKLFKLDLNFKRSLARALKGIHADGLIISSPCQGYSPAGEKLGDRDPRSMLYQRIPEDIDLIDPEFCIIENSIETVRTHTQGYRLMQALMHRRYHVAVWDIDAVNYGSPSRRRRAFIVASKRGLPDKPKPREAAQTVRDAIGGWSEKYAMAWGCEKFSEGRKRQAMGLPIGWSPKKSYKMDWDKPTTAITTTMNNKSYRIHPEQPRPPSVREAAALMGLKGHWKPHPDHSVADNYRHIGNGMAFHAIDAVCRAMALAHKH